jgi:hypothetical protein
MRIQLKDFRVRTGAMGVITRSTTRKCAVHCFVGTVWRVYATARLAERAARILHRVLAGVIDALDDIEAGNISRTALG